MTDTRNTPVEALERAFPLRVLRYRLRRGSGGAGWAPGGGRAFRDITGGINNVSGKAGCCDAAPGYDLASGLGSLRFAGLAEALGTQVRPPTSTSTTPPPPAGAFTPRFTG